MKHVRVNDTEIAFEERGRGAPMLLLHGFARDHTVWGPPADALEKKYRLIIPDLRGMGGTKHPDPNEPITMEMLADDAAGLLEALNIDSAVVAGFSMGGYILLYMLLRHPSRVDAAAFVGTRATADSPEKKKERLAQNEQVLRDGTAPMAREYVLRLFSASFESANPQVLEETFQNFASQEPRNVALLNEAMRLREDMTSRIEEIPCPCLVIGGTEDVLVAPEAMVSLHEALKDSTLEMIEGAGHMIPVESPERVADALDRFMVRIGN